MVKYDDLVRDPLIFWENLAALIGFSTETFQSPIVGSQTLDLHTLFVEVTSRGGMAKVTKNRKWKEVEDVFNFPTTITNGSYLLKKYYLKFLSQFENVYFLENLVPSSSQSKDEAMESLAIEEPSPKEEAEGNEELQVGSVVKGVIDGKFDCGYLVTMKVGSEEMKGVLYQVPETPKQTEQTIETPSANVASSSERRCKKKAKR